ncbi:homoserine O-succinyltransferase [Leuconostoc mesenteroides]|uniref:homoserine O-succinyltransferase n=1 Tax=Leuconostoc mesenteroides TaxID=1245 RepID=UPI00235EB62F|nr:homoserine O-succinyltransferase [Leuconostoc mesenteroides]
MSVILNNGLLKRESFVIGRFEVLEPTINILLVNLMPNRLQTEKQFTRLLSHLPINVRVTFAVPSEHEIRHDTDAIMTNYVTLNDIWHKKFDGMIVTGAPVDRMKFEQIDYWDEFRHLLEWRKTHVTESLFACWAAYGAGYAERNFPVKALSEKISGVFQASQIFKRHSLLKDLENISMPQSRYFTAPNFGVARRLKVAGDDILGAFILRDEHVNSTYITGHFEYDTETLENEYLRDIAIDPNTIKPKNHFYNNKPTNTWQTYAEKFFVNWGELLMEKMTSSRSTIPTLNQERNKLGLGTSQCKYL